MKGKHEKYFMHINTQLRIMHADSSLKSSTSQSYDKRHLKVVSWKIQNTMVKATGEGI